MYIVGDAVRGSRLSRSPVGGSQSELFSFLTHMKNDLSTQMTTQNHDVMREVGTINRKIDGLTKKVNDLQSENETLKRENSKMQKQLNSVISKLDYIEGQSRRNNVRITGLHGRIDEEWATTEQKVRSFITNELDMQELDQKKVQVGKVDIDRAHRIKSSDQNKCTVIVKFNRFKDREAVLKKASEILDNDSPYTVRQDLTQRVKKHRRELGKEMIAAKARGQQARIKFDKLEVDGDLYRYDDTLEEIVLIPRTVVDHSFAHELGQVMLCVTRRRMADWSIASEVTARESKARQKVSLWAERWAGRMTYSARNEAEAQMTILGFPLLCIHVLMF